MTITTNNSAEFDALCKRAIAGEFRILFVEQGDTNSQWIFFVSEGREQRDLFAAPPPMEEFYE